MLLWVLDWVESQPAQRRADETTFLLAGLWRSAVGEVGRSRLLDVVGVLSAETGESLDIQRSALASVIRQEFTAALHDDSDAGLVSSVDIALTQRDSRLLSVIAGVLRDSEEFRRLERSIYARLQERLPFLGEAMRDTVLREFPGLEGR